MLYNQFQSRIPKYLLVGGAAAAAGLAVGYALLKKNREHDYLRFENGNLETSIRRFEHPTKQLTIDLVGAIHVADMEYFDSLKEHLDGLDLVLYEMVSVSEDEEIPDYAILLRRFYTLLAGELNLAVQTEAMGYKVLPKHWEHCDLSEGEMAEHGNGLLYQDWFTNNIFYDNLIQSVTIVLDVLEEQVNTASGKGEEGMFSPFKKKTAEKLVRGMSNPILTQIQMLVPDILLGKGALMDARNQVVCDRLEHVTECWDGWHIGVFYGAAHLPDIEDYLKELGYEHRATFWQPAWKLD